MTVISAIFLDWELHMHHFLQHQVCAGILTMFSFVKLVVNIVVVEYYKYKYLPNIIFVIVSALNWSKSISMDIIYKSLKKY